MNQVLKWLSGGDLRSDGVSNEIVDQVQYQGDAFIVSRHGKPAAAIVPVEVYENWKQQRRMFFDAIRKLQDANKTVDPEAVWEDVLKAQQAVRFSSR